MISREKLFELLISKSCFHGNDSEQDIVAAYLGNDSGYYVDVGAFHPTEASQTYHLELSGWDGICIEPHPRHANGFLGARKCEIVQAACVSPDCPENQIVISDHGQRSSAVVKREEASGYITVPAMTLDKILSERSVSRVDFISIDVEGMEIDVMRGFSVKKYRPRLVLLEDFGEGLSRHRYMRSVEYKRVRRTGNNSWYVPNTADFPVSVFGRWQLTRKYYLAMPIRWIKNLFRPPQQ